MIDRRAFVTALLSVPVALCVPPLIGEAKHAGGFYVPVPSNLADYVTFSGPFEPPDQDIRIERAIAHVAWAKLGAHCAEVQMFGGTIVLAGSDPALTVASRRNVLQSMRTLFEGSHEPGWFKVLRAEPDGGVDGDGYPTMRTWSEWTRIGYLRYLMPSDLSSRCEVQR